MMIRKLQAILIGGILIASLGEANAQTSAPADEAPSWGAGMMGGYGPGMMGGYGPAMMGGYGPGMMGGYGPGMMGGYGGGPGMMGGYGGPGMMGGYGQGMMGEYGFGRGAGMNLTDDQRQRIRQVTDGMRKQHWALMGQMMEERIKLRDLLEQPTPDPKAVGAAHAGISSLQQQMLESHVQVRNDIHGILTPEQREQLEQRQQQRQSGQDGRRGGNHGPRGMMPRQ